VKSFRLSLITVRFNHSEQHIVPHQWHTKARLILQYPSQTINAPINVKLLGGGKARDKLGILSQISFSVQMPGLREVILGHKVQIPHSRSIIVNQKNSTNDQKSLPHQIPVLCPASLPPPPVCSGTLSDNYVTYCIVSKSG